MVVSKIDAVIASMKEEARALKGEFVSWREPFSKNQPLINCRLVNGDFEWRAIASTSNNGRRISEVQAKQELEQMSDQALRIQAA